jgi:aspartate/methionine/tyrosine aminotransferase
MEVLKAATARQASHGDAILLCVGQPATPAPAPVLRRAAQVVGDDVLGYTEVAGRADLRAVIAQHYLSSYGVAVDPEEVVVTTGSSGGFLLTVLAAFEAGDEVAMTRPGYPAYRNDLSALGCRVIELDVDASTRFQPTVPMLQALPRPPAGLVLASPANPTGTVVDRAWLADVAAWCEAHECLLISDEIYHGISFAAACDTAWHSGRETSIVIGSLSKYYSMTGWRLGWVLAPQPWRRRINLLQGNLAICAPAISQAAGVAAFSVQAQAELDAHVARYRRNRDVVLDRLPQLGITNVAPPDGAFYAYCDISHLTSDSQTWCADILDRTGVALAPGIDFDTANGRRFMRLSFCGETDHLTEAFDRLALMV